MSVVLDILRSYSAPRLIQRRRIGTAEREDRALATLMAACVLIFVAQWPRLAREAFISNTNTLEALLAGALFGWLVVAPLFFYGLAAATLAVLRLLGRTTSGYEVRMTLFWGLLAASPLWLLTGLMSGFVGPTAATMLIGLIALGAFLAFWGAGLKEISGKSQAEVT